MDRKTRFLLIMCILAVFHQAKAQFDDPKTLEVGPHVGASYYIGDLNPQKHFAMADLEFGGVVRLNWDHRWSFRFDYSRVKVKADDVKIGWRPERGLNFTSNINDFSFVVEFNFVEYYTGNPKRNVSPYIFGGVSLFQYTPYAIVNDTLVGLYENPDENGNMIPVFTEGPLPDNLKWYQKLFTKMPYGISIPFGVGVKLSLSRHMAATVEWRLQKTFTDYLDDVKGEYPADDQHEMHGSYDLTDPTGNYHAGQQRGNSAFNDWFGMARVSLTWKFNLPDSRGCNLSKF